MRFSLSLTQSVSNGCNLVYFWLTTQKYRFLKKILQHTKYMSSLLEYLQQTLFFSMSARFFVCIFVCMTVSLFYFLYFLYLLSTLLLWTLCSCSEYRYCIIKPATFQDICFKYQILYRIFEHAHDVARSPPVN